MKKNGYVRAQTPSDPVTAADQKLTKVSISFDSRSANNDLSGFSGALLNKRDFQTQLRRCLNINLKQIEVDALFAKMDVDNSGLIDGVEFVRYFFALGIEARWKRHIEKMLRNTKRLEEEKQKKIDDANKMKEWEAAQVSAFDEADTISAMKKLQNAAFCWDPTNHIACLYINGFQAHLNAYMFKQQLYKSFGLQLSSSELGALSAQFKTQEGEYCIDGHLFLKKFSALRKKAWVEHGQSRVANKLRKEAVLGRARPPDVLPKLLGR